eukprot:scaffold4079_cov392-Prasinococcus_capsulatus_cf.AAC.8
MLSRLALSKVSVVTFSQPSRLRFSNKDSPFTSPCNTKGRCWDRGVRYLTVAAARHAEALLTCRSFPVSAELPSGPWTTFRRRRKGT